MYYTEHRIENLHRVFDQNGREGYLRLDLNENPGGLPEEFVKSVLLKVTPNLVSQYPETDRFSQTLADYLGTEKDRLCVVNGSAEGIRYIIESFTSPNGRIVGVVPSYFMFQIYSQMYGRHFVQVPYNDDLSMDVERIIGSLTEDTQLLVLLNPNNPIGNVYSDEEIEEIISVAREKEINILIDEAYHYFCEKTYIKYAIENEHVFVTRTFSKLFSMAGCRLGYVVGWPNGISVVQKLCTPHNTNAFALLFAEHLLKTPQLIESLICEFNKGRDFLLSWLDDHNYVHYDGAGNFIFIKPNRDARFVVDEMKKRGVLIKMYPDVGNYGDCLRVTIGAKEYMMRFVSVLSEVD